MDRLSQIVMPGAFPLLAAVGLVLLLGGVAMWYGRFPVKRVRALLTGDPGCIPVVVDTECNPAADEMSQEPSRYEFDVAVSCREDPYKVIAILDNVGDELRRDPPCGPDVVGPLEILGVDRFENSAVVVRCRITKKAIGEQRVRKEINRRLQTAFQQPVIEIPFVSRELARVNSETRQAPPLYVIVEDNGPTGNGSLSES